MERCLVRPRKLVANRDDAALDHVRMYANRYRWRWSKFRNPSESAPRNRRGSGSQTYRNVSRSTERGVSRSETPHANRRFAQVRAVAPKGHTR